MTRRVLFITDDMQRWDTIGAWNGPGAQCAQTPVIDGLARDGIQYWRGYNQNPLCMPSRSTMLTGQYTRTYGSWNNGIALPHDSPSVAEHLKRNTSMRTALIGKPHFEPFSSRSSMESSLGIQNSYHTDWVADHTTRWIDSMDPEDDWFCWMSFPDPHHPYDPPSSENHRVDWSDIDVDELYGTSEAERVGWLDQKPKHWKW